MEQFKACEKETKTKAYSKEGLGLQKHDNDALNQARAWVGMSFSFISSSSLFCKSTCEYYAFNAQPAGSDFTMCRLPEVIICILQTTFSGLRDAKSILVIPRALQNQIISRIAKSILAQMR